MDLADGSPTAANPPGRRLGDRRLIVGLAAATMLAFAVAPTVNAALGKKNKDYTLWYRTGRLVLDGGELYPKDTRLFPFMYPPSCAALLAVGSLAGEPAMVLGLIAINSAAWVAAALLSVALATGGAWRRHPLLYVVPTLGVIAYIHDTYLLGQPNLLLLALMLGSFACLRGRRQVAAGALIALAAAIKAFPVLAIGYLVYRRAWKATAALVVTLALLLIALPMPFRGPSRAWDDLATWTMGMVLKYDEGSIAQRPERCFSYKNQSLVALSNRLLRAVPADGEAKDGWYVNVVDLDFHAVNAVVAACALGLGLAFLAAMPLREGRARPTSRYEEAMLLILIIIFSPLSFNYSYVWLMYPLTVGLGLVLEEPAGSRGRRRWAAWFATALAILAVTIPFLREAHAYGSLIAAALWLFAGLGLRSARELAEAGESTSIGAVAGLLPARRWAMVLGAAGAVAVVAGSVLSMKWYDWFEKRTAVVEPGRIVRGGWQRPGPLRKLIEREKIKTIVTLVDIREDSPRYLDQAKVVRETGVRWFILPMPGSTATTEQMALAADLIGNPALQPVYFHCVAGHHRSNLAQAAYRIRHDGWSAERAWWELMHHPWTQAEGDWDDRRLIERFDADPVAHRAGSPAAPFWAARLPDPSHPPAAETR
ncbi:MAG TPA: glycosyltransferase 87 family protein [Isosphaeraceae bacterium]|jgi:hypothetical protein|nr:glycosyltransferase 87 family protein [Isosphaeraceae bacterium]